VSLDFAEDTPMTRMQMRTASASVMELKGYIDSICQVGFPGDALRAMLLRQ
jgi:hypothetical protein